MASKGLKKHHQAIDTNKHFESGVDITEVEKDLLDDIVSKTGFIPEEVIWRSSYWGTKQIGAVHYKGKYEGNKAVLKIQGANPDVSEAFMIEQFANQNRSKVVRPPKLFKVTPWSDDSGYEALIMEFVEGEKVLTSCKLQNNGKIREFLRYYQEYRQNCLPIKPWLPAPFKPDWGRDLEKALATSQKVFPNHPYRKEEDEKLATQAYGALAEIYQDVPLEFVHGHFSVEDLIYQGDEVVLFSNLFWKWKFPFYDAVFGYHWFIYALEHIPGITTQQIEE